MAEMQALMQVLDRLRFQVIALLIGSVLILLASFKVEDVKTLNLSPYASPIYPVLYVGLG